MSCLQVYKGMWQNQMIAVKVCRQEHKSVKTMRQFQNEVAILNGCSHKNVVEFIGACCWKVGSAFSYRSVRLIDWLDAKLLSGVIWCCGDRDKAFSYA